MADSSDKTDDSPPLLKISGSLTQLPPWVPYLLLLLGIPVSGGAGSMWGAQQTATDLARLEDKVDTLSAEYDKLDEKLDQLKYALIRAHAADPTFMPPGGNQP